MPRAFITGITGQDGQHLAEFLQFMPVVAATRRIGRTIEKQQTRAVCNGFLELSGRELEVVFDAGCDGYGCAVSDPHHVGVRHPVRSGHDRFVAGAEP